MAKYYRGGAAKRSIAESVNYQGREGRGKGMSMGQGAAAGDAGLTGSGGM